MLKLCVKHQPQRTSEKIYCYGHEKNTESKHNLNKPLQSARACVCVCVTFATKAIFVEDRFKAQMVWHGLCLL